MTATIEAPNAPRRALMPRLGSLVAFAPVGIWTAWHLWDNLSAFSGAAVWESRVTAPRSAIAEFTTTAVVLVPLALHAVWGLRRLSISRVNLQRYALFGNAKYVLQRVSALGLLAFIPAHVYLARIAPQLAHGRHERFDELAQQIRWHGPTLVVYLLGVLGTAYHLGNGLASGGMTWGYAVTARAMKRLNAVAVVAFLAMLAAGWAAVYALWAHGATLPPISG